MAGLKVVPVKSLPDGSLDHKDLREKAEKHKDNLAAFMVCMPHLFISFLLSIYLDHLPIYFRRFRSRCARGLPNYS